MVYNTVLPKKIWPNTCDEVLISYLPSNKIHKLDKITILIPLIVWLYNEILMLHV